MPRRSAGRLIRSDTIACVAPVALPMSVGLFTDRERSPAGATHGDRQLPPALRWRTTARMPRRISIGDGGQPGTVASTGITLATLPQLA